MDDRSGGMRGQAAPTNNGMAIAGLVLAICAVALSWTPGINSPETNHPANDVCWVLGLIFTSIGLKKANRGAPYRGMAIAGLVISLAGIVLIIILVVIIGVGSALSA